MLSAFALLAILAPQDTASRHVGDAAPLVDPLRPVTRIDRNSFTLQYYTATPTETRVQYRQDEVPLTAFGRKAPVQWKTANAPGGKKTWHTITVAALDTGKRYFYRVWDPEAKPTSAEENWGAKGGWRREYAVSTQAPSGSKTIIHIPVKVLLMPNVVNVASAHDQSGNVIAPNPPKMTEADIQKIRDEYMVSSRFFWVNSGMRLWVDYQIQIDDRWQRWGPEPAKVGDFYKDWPVSRSYAGQDFAAPGGGDFTIVDTKDPLKVSKEPVVEERPFSGQVEMAWTRRWANGKWEFYNSGGGTYGVDGFPQGFPGRSQFLGGGDTAWLATHEFHHNLESHGSFSLANREDERIVFNHYAARNRVVRSDGSAEENAWTTSGRHGEHWDGMAFWDRSLSDAQWLRMYFGYTTTTPDRDGDGFPDEDPRLPLDERRFGSNPNRTASDGLMNDLQKVMLSTWVPAPLQPSWTKPAFQAVKPSPTKPDTDEDGIPDGSDPYPLYPWQPFIYPMHAGVDGDPAEWQNVPVAGLLNGGSMMLTWQQAHDQSGYFGLIRIKGPWRRIDATFDGEGLGVYSGVGVQGFQVLNLSPDGPAAGPNNAVVEVRPQFGRAAGLKWKASKRGDETIFEFSFPNRGEGIWYWNGGGREIGSIITAWNRENQGFSVYEPYRPFYARMLEPHGKAPLPPNPPAELQPGAGVQVFKPGDPAITLTGGWKLENGAYRHSGPNEDELFIKGLKAKDFDLFAIIEGKSDGILAAFLPRTREMTAGVDYIAFVGGYGNRVTRLRLFGNEAGDEPVIMTPGPHRIQLSRRGGDIWLLVDGKPVIYAPDPNPTATVDRLAVLGGYGGEQVVREIRIRVPQGG